MFDAQLLFAKPDPGTEVFSDWSNRRGDLLICTLEVIEIDGAEITVEMFTKKAEDVGNGTVVGGSYTASTTGRFEFESGPNDFNDLVRYRFTVIGTVSEWVLFRMLTMVWFDSV